MEVQLTSDQERSPAAPWSRTARSEEGAVREALALWEERERRRIEFRATIDERALQWRVVKAAYHTESMRERLAQVRERGRAASSRNWPRQVSGPPRCDGRAESDLDDIWLYVRDGKRQFGVASRWSTPSRRDSFFSRGSRTQADPRSRFRLGTTAAFVGEYVIVYSVEGPDVFILRVVHAGGISSSVRALIRPRREGGIPCEDPFPPVFFFRRKRQSDRRRIC